MPKAQMIKALCNGVIEGGSPACGNGGDFFFEIFCAVGERLSAEDLKPDVIVEIDDEHLVLRIAGMSERGNGSTYFGQLRTHATAVVDNQANGHGRVFLLEEGELLLAAILEHAEILETQPRDDISI
jgi:hypothetical protein